MQRAPPGYPLDGTKTNPVKMDMDEPLPAVPQNIMFDRRVCRGSTYARRVIPLAQQQQMKAQQQQQQRNQSKSRARKKQYGSEDQRAPGEQAMGREKTPEPVHGRVHSEIQTETFLEVLTDKPEEKDCDMQTDPFLDRPDSPMFMPMPSGESRATQVEEGELFDFDLEVRPIVEVLVGKTLDQALMEVLEEKEMQELRNHREQFEQLRNVELAEAQRLEARETRLFEEKQRRKHQEQDRILHEEELARKLASRTVAKQYLSNLHSTVFQSLAASGHFCDPLIAEVEKEFMPWLLNSVTERVEARRIADLVVEDVMDDAIAAGVKTTKTQLQNTRDALEAIRLQLEQKQRLEEEEAAEQERIAAQQDEQAEAEEE